MPNKLQLLYYGALGFVRNKFYQDPFSHRRRKRYVGVRAVSAGNMNECIKEGLQSGNPLMVCRFGGFEMFAMRSAEFDQREKMEEAMGFLDKSAGFFPADSRLLYRFNELMREDCGQADYIGCWMVAYEDYYIRHYCSSVKRVSSLMALEPWNCMEAPWTAALKGKRVLVIHPFEDTIRSQYEKREKLFENPQLLPEFTLLTLKAVQTSGSQRDDRFQDWFEALDYMKSQCDALDFDVALIGCGAYGFPLAAHIKRMGKQAIHLGGVLQILFGIKGRRWDESDTRLMYNEHWVYPGKNEIPKGAGKIENACYWAAEDGKTQENGGDEDAERE